MRLIIDGGGIGGLAAAVSFEQRGGDDVVLLEQAPRFSEIGAGIPPVSQEMAMNCHLNDTAAIDARNRSMRERALTDSHGEWMRQWLWGYDVVTEADKPLEETTYHPVPTLVQGPPATTSA